MSEAADIRKPKRKWVAPMMVEYDPAQITAGNISNIGTDLGIYS